MNTTHKTDSYGITEFYSGSKTPQQPNGENNSDSAEPNVYETNFLNLKGKNIKLER